MNKNTKNEMYANEKVYLRVKKAKADVERFVQDYGEITDPKAFFEESCMVLSPDAKQVIGAGIIFNSPKYGYQFSMPKTSDILKFLIKKSKAYEEGYAKMSVLDGREDISKDDKATIRVSKITRFEVVIDEETNPKWKDLVGVMDVDAGEDRTEADEYVKAIGEFFEEALDYKPSVNISDFEERFSKNIVDDEVDKTKYGWTDIPVLYARKNPTTGHYYISLPPCARL